MDGASVSRIAKCFSFKHLIKNPDGRPLNFLYPYLTSLHFFLLEGRSIRILKSQKVAKP